MIIVSVQFLTVSPGTRAASANDAYERVGRLEALEQFEYFWKEESVFSQWYKVTFVVDGIKYNCAEQYMMHQKAELMGDTKTAIKILKATSPKKQKALGRKIQNFDSDLWDSNCIGIVKKGNIAKFSSNNRLKQRLYDTCPKILVEASPYDTIWGIGLKEDDPAAWQKDTWRGQNLLGQVLTDVRDEMMKTDSAI
ncbi:hypothetical protein ScPMuIL_017895 [Solemya velum]